MQAKGVVWDAIPTSLQISLVAEGRDKSFLKEGNYLDLIRVYVELYHGMPLHEVAREKIELCLPKRTDQGGVMMYFYELKALYTVAEEGRDVKDWSDYPGGDRLEQFLFDFKRNLGHEQLENELYPRGNGRPLLHKGGLQRKVMNIDPSGALLWGTSASGTWRTKA